MKQLITTYSTLMDAQKEGRGEVRGGGGVVTQRFFQNSKTLFTASDYFHITCTPLT